MSISQTICDFATLAIEAGGWMEMDRLYLQNRLLGMVGEDALESIEVRPVKEESRKRSKTNRSRTRGGKSRLSYLHALHGKRRI